MSNKLKQIFLIIPCAYLGACAATPDNNMGYLLQSTGNYTAQDTDALQNGYQEFQGQLNYAAGHDQEASSEAADGTVVQDKMYDEYQSQIKAQQLQK